MNNPIRRVMLAICAIFAILLLHITYIQIFRADALRSDSRNKRELLAEYSRQRGQITAGTDVIAQSIVTDDDLKYLRTYPKKYAAAYAPLTGYYSYILASSGLEQSEDDVLNGNDNRLFSQQFIDLFSGRNPRGGNIITTIVPRLQRTAYDAMKQGCSEGCRGSVVALNPKTGEILALVSTPSFDPNPLSSHNPEIVQKAWNNYNSNPNQPMLNRATSQLYPPGSTFKIISTAVALEQGVSPDTRLTAASTIQLPGTTTDLTNYAGMTCPNSYNGTVTLHQAFQYSCNTSFVELLTKQLRNPIDSFKKQANLLGVDARPASLPLPVATSTVGPIIDLAALGQSAIGQRDVRITPLQNAMIAATVANGGVTMVPYLVSQLQGPTLTTLSKTSPTPLGQAFSAGTAATLTEMMIDSEAHTRGGGALPIASKTGTAEHAKSAAGGEVPYTWYVAFGPTTAAEIAVAVIIENPTQGTEATGGSAAAPIGRAVIASQLGEQ